jgi:hypothetical protein
MDVAEREAQLRGSIDATMNNRLVRTGAIQLADVDENTRVESADEDLVARACPTLPHRCCPPAPSPRPSALLTRSPRSASLATERAAMAEYAEYVEDDTDTGKMSEPLQALMRHMHSYATRYNVDVYRSLKENGGRQSKDGNGAMSKVKFTSVLLSAFARMNEMFKAHLLDELTTIYGTGPLEGGEVNIKKNLAAAYAGRLTGSPNFDASKAKGTRMEVMWIRFANDVGEAYMTYPPRGHGNELGTQELASDYLEEGKLYAD